MLSFKQQIAAVQMEFKSKLAEVGKLKDLDTVRVVFLGKQGKVTSLFQNMKTLTVEKRKELGPILNNLKEEVESGIVHAKSALVEKVAQAAQLKKKNFDVTAYQTDVSKGHLHPYTQFTEEIESIFMSMGYDIMDGPFVESEWYNFTALNIPEDHPAKDMYDTLWLKEKGFLLRTQTSTVQIRAMEQKKPPIAIIAPGYTFRYEAVDASHDVMFQQCEGLLIDKNVTLAHLFATVQELLKVLFQNKKLDIRIRPGFFPFVEPGVEIDMRCPFCKTGCSVCKKSTWIEVFPGGLVHPNVLKAGGIDPEKYSGVAFGFGLTRLAMLKYKIDDIRLFLSGKVKFLEQF